MRLTIAHIVDSVVSLHAVVARAFAVALGVFVLGNALLGRFVAGSDGNQWWINLDSLPTSLRLAFLAGVGASLLVLAARPARVSARLAASAFVATAAAIALCDAREYYTLIERRVITARWEVPLSLVFAVLLCAAMASSFARRVSLPRRNAAAVGALALAAVIFGFPLAQMVLYGQTDYRRQADAIVVFGARAYRNGSPSQPLADRVRTACALYHQGVAPAIVFSGGPGDGDFHETDVMRSYAIAHGVPAEAIRVDTLGWSTRETVRHTLPILSSMQARRIIAVSHAYHLPRVKLAFRQAGVQVYTVPAREPYTLRAMPWLMAREVAAFWAYQLRAT